jgi:hypothetical protein
MVDLNKKIEDTQAQITQGGLDVSSLTQVIDSLQTIYDGVQRDYDQKSGDLEKAKTV